MDISVIFQEDGNETTNDKSEAEREDAGNDCRTGADILDRRPGVDHFDNEESNPAKSHALRKCCFPFVLQFLYSHFFV